MIDFYTWTTPNGRKVSIMLEELGVEYTTHSINIGEDEQFDPEFLAISPNNKIPAIVDQQTGISLMESGAILQYLADKYGQFCSKDPAQRWKTHEWLMWQMAGFGANFGAMPSLLEVQSGAGRICRKTISCRGKPALRGFGQAAGRARLHR